MSVQEKRAEILRLIAKVNQGEPARVAADRTAGAASAPDRVDHRTPSRPGLDELDRRRQQLAEITRRRERIEAALPNHVLLDRIDTLEGRLDRLERAVGGGVATSLASSSSRDREPDDYTLAGVLREGLLSDVLQLVASNMMSGDFVVATDTAEVHLYFNEGEICHATGPDVTGAGAVFIAMAAEMGRYHFRETTELPEERTVQGNTQFVILEALRQVDEQRAPQDS